MRDPLLNDTLRRLAADAAARLTTLVAAGDPIPFDVARVDGPQSPFHSYVPLTSRYVEEREDEIRALASYGAAREAVEAADVAAAYLEGRGERVPADRRSRSERMLIVFLASLWEGASEFTLDRERLEGALTALDAEVRDISEADVLIAPLIGLTMPGVRLDLPNGVRIVRADTMEAPPEALRGAGDSGSWRPRFLAVAEQGETPESGGALRQLRDLVSVLRLFKGGAVGLGPHAFAPAGEGWRPVATGAPGVRPGGYSLTAEEAERLPDFARELEARPDPDGALAWAVRRFELGCGRDSALDGLSDHLLALRAVLEGKGPVGASLPLRAAALLDGGSTQRLEARQRFEDAMELERALMRGERPADAGSLAAWVEDGVRGILRDAALGEIRADLGTAADESLIASGLSEGDAQIAVAAVPPAPVEEPVAPEPEPEPVVVEPSFAAVEEAPADAPQPPTADPIPSIPSVEAEGPADDFDPPRQEELMDQETRIMEPVPGPDEIRITATNWLEEVEAETGPHTIEWPAGASGPGSRERIDTPTVRHLFPQPEAADWEVGELEYDHYRRRRAG